MAKSKKRKKEEVAVSFHFLVRYGTPDASGEMSVIPFNDSDFDRLYKRIAERQCPNVEAHDESDPIRALRIENRQEVPFGPPERVDLRTIFGKFGGAYTGHSYGNSIKGEISAESVNLRPFFYLLYLSESGRIYVATQYIGHFGAYEPLARTLRALLGDPATVGSHSYRVGAGFYAGARPKEVRIGYARDSEQDHKRSSIGTRGALIFKKSDADDDFEDQVTKRMFPALGKSGSDVKKAAAALAADADLISLSDDDVRDCSIIAEFRGRQRTLHLLEGGHAASRLPIDVEVDLRGHPLEAPCRVAMTDLLRDAVIKRTENAGK